MSRRRLTLIVSLLTAATLTTACASPTAPQPKQACQTTNGVNTCPTGP